MIQKRTSRVETTALGAEREANVGEKPSPRAPSPHSAARAPSAHPAQMSGVIGATAAAPSGAATLLRLESELRRLRTLKEFQYFAANELRVVTRSQQTFVFQTSRSAKQQVSGVSAMATIDRSAPLINWIEALVGELAIAHGLDKTQEFTAESFRLPSGAALPGYPLPFLLWVPFVDFDNRVVGGMLQARMQPWSEADLVVSRHLAGACSQTLMVLSGRNATWRVPQWRASRALLVAGAVMLAAGFVPVSMTALAPVEVSPQKALVVTAPVDGVIENILVEPNAVVLRLI